MEQCHEHENQQHASAQLHVRLGSVLVQLRDAGKQGARFGFAFRQQQENSSDESQIPAKESRGYQTANPSSIRNLRAAIVGTLSRGNHVDVNIHSTTVQVVSK